MWIGVQGALMMTRALYSDFLRPLSPILLLSVTVLAVPSLWGRAGALASFLALGRRFGLSLLLVLAAGFVDFGGGQVAGVTFGVAFGLGGGAAVEL